jgi:hypothetical protein
VGAALTKPGRASTARWADQEALKALDVTRGTRTPAPTSLPTGNGEGVSPSLAEMKLMMAKLKELIDAVPE